MASQKFDDGAPVMARWPGSSLYYEVQVTSFDPSSQLYTVRYKDGTELDLKENDLKNLSTFRPKKRSSASPSRRSSRSRSRSPARTKSPGRQSKKVQQPSPVSVTRDSRKGDYLKVQQSSPVTRNSQKFDYLKVQQPSPVTRNSQKGDYLKVQQPSPVTRNSQKLDYLKAQQPSPVTRNSQKGDYLKVQLTPLRIEDYSIGKSNGEAESFGKTVDFLREQLVTNIETDYLREPLRRNVEREDYFRETLRSNTDRGDYFRESLLSNKVNEAKVEEEVVQSERVLRYRRRNEDSVEREFNNIQVIKEKPAVEIRPEHGGTSEFGGAIGTFFMTLSLPPLLYYLLYQNTQKNATLLNFYPHWSLADLWNPTVLGYFALWILLNALFYLLPIGKVAYGVPLANGKRLQYRLHGLHSLVFIAVVVSALWHYQVNLLYVYKHLHQFAAAATLFSVVFSVYALVRSYGVPKDDLSEAGKCGNFIYTFFMGRELNPHIGNFDLKYFTAIQPAFNGWIFLNVIMILAEMDVQKLDKPSVSMILVNGFQLLYVLHALWYQEGILTSLDIASDGFGFMLAFGGLAMVPFLYSLQAIYLVKHPVDLSCTVFAAIIALNTLGYFLFRYSNNQKFAFRKNPDDPKLSHLKTIPTSAGSNLIVSGLWGWIRHPNYLGDLLMAWAWCLPCGFSSVLPYFYGFFLTGLLLHRVTRVERQCKIKYGPDWQKYCQHVPYRLFPYIY